MARISFSSPQRIPPPREATRPRVRTTAKTAPTGSPGSACTAVPAAKASAIAGRAVRGGSRSAPESRKVAPSTWASEGPNMLTADSSGEPVTRNTSVPRASPPTVCAAVCAAEPKKRGANSGVRRRVR
ncbi:hypothetical protein GCM10010521_16320 [Streptomyces rameus]|uniref:Uncharacterized protein n=1 Tax=Streptomyces rameus TaxID=68261 RepID=A0ABP6MZ16_9ACTN